MNSPQKPRKIPHLFKFMMLLILSAMYLNFTAAQSKITVTGKVTEPITKNPLPNVSVMIKSTSTGVITNETGDYTISVPAGTVLVFTYLTNASQDVKVLTSGIVNVSLSSKPQNLEEVVVIGYGTRKKKDLTGAVSTIDATLIAKSTALTPELAMQGQMSGVSVTSGGGNPSARPVIRIRGVTTFGNADPLYVIDGIPIEEGGAGATADPVINPA